MHDADNFHDVLHSVDLKFCTQKSSSAGSHQKHSCFELLKITITSSHLKCIWEGEPHNELELIQWNTLSCSSFHCPQDPVPIKVDWPISKSKPDFPLGNTSSVYKRCVNEVYNIDWSDSKCQGGKFKT